MSVKRYGRHGVSTCGKPALHPATVDLKGKTYEYVSYLADYMTFYSIKT